MELLIIIVFLIGYLLITLEHPLKIDKAAPALLLGVITWAIFALMSPDYHVVNHELEHHLPEIVNILFFLLGAMTIVELIDIHDGFHVITNRLKTKSKRKMLWLICFLTFFMSATLDNLTTAIVMASLLRKLIEHKQVRLVFAGMVVIAANAGGAWSPIGDVTTTMLWIGGQISVISIVKWLIVPSLVCMIIPLIYLSMKEEMKGDFSRLEMNVEYKTTQKERLLVLFAGVSCLIFVPIFKTVTHLPPFMGMFFGVGVMWLITELMHKKKSHDEKSKYSVLKALSKIDAASVLFFFGILAGVACLSSIGVLKHVAVFLDETIGNMDIIVMVIGALSSVVDNVPLVAATMKMYSLETFPMDHKLWAFLAYCAGTGGSMLIIGSAAGVAIMGIEKIEFFWYLRKMGFLALIGYIAGALTYLGMYAMFY